MTLIAELLALSLFVLTVSCKTRVKNYRGDTDSYEKGLTTSLQDFEDIPEGQEPAFDLAIRSYDHLWDKKELSVCWENGNNHKNGQSITQQIVTAEFARVGFNFTGWKLCDGKGANIRVVVADHLWPGVDAIGNKLDNKINGMRLTFTFDRAGPTGWAYRCKVNDNYVENCIRNYALHEFGHAIGLGHEANREDSRCSQKTNASVISIGNYDENSIMNYCYNMASIQNNEKPQLSNIDVSEINKLYASVSSVEPPEQNPQPEPTPIPAPTPSPAPAPSGQDFDLTGSGNNLTASGNGLSCPTNGDNSGFKSIDNFNLSNGSVIAKISLDTGITNHTQYFGVEGPGGNLYLRLFRWGNNYQLKARHDTIDIAHKSYSPTSDRYLKISHQAAYNRVTFSTSSDGKIWTAFAFRTFTGTNDMNLIYRCGYSASTIEDIKINNVAKSFQ